MILLTKIDKLGEYLKKDLTDVYRSTLVRDTVDMLAEHTGIDTRHIMPVKNYDSECSRVSAIDVLALTAMRDMLRRAGDFFRQQHMG